MFLYYNHTKFNEKCRLFLIEQGIILTCPYEKVKMDKKKKLKWAHKHSMLY